MREPIQIDDLLVKAHHLFSQQWMLLTSGDFKEGRYNTMTVGWGSLGTIWRKPFVLVAVRPSRYTYEFMNLYDSFTLTAFPEEHRNALNLMGTKSGRNSDKIAESGLTSIASTKVAAPGFDEAELIIECSKIYWDDFKPDRFLDPSIKYLYPNDDYHRIFFGEVLAIFGENFYKSA